MRCRLCRKDTDLRQSHIVPESAYGPLYDSKHRFLEVTNIKEYMRPMQKGLRERLLCGDCEQYLNRKYETYFANTWFHNGPIQSHAPNELTTVTGLDYHRFKLFHLSILWRAGIATREEFTNVNLGEHEERIRKAIIDDSPGDPTYYSIFAFIPAMPQTHEVCHRLLIQPICVDLFDTPGFHVTFGGCIWHYLLTDAADLEKFPFMLKEDGVLHMLRVDVDEYDPLMDLMKGRISQGWRRGIDNG
jgi:hypothetical protein